MRKDGLKGLKPSLRGGRPYKLSYEDIEEILIKNREDIESFLKKYLYSEEYLKGLGINICI